MPTTYQSCPKVIQASHVPEELLPGFSGCEESHSTPVMTLRRQKLGQSSCTHCISSLPSQLYVPSRAYMFGIRQLIMQLKTSTIAAVAGIAGCTFSQQMDSTRPGSQRRTYRGRWFLLQWVFSADELIHFSDVSNSSGLRDWCHTRHCCLLDRSKILKLCSFFRLKQSPLHCCRIDV